MVYSTILAPILIQIGYAVHTHKKIKVIGKQLSDHMRIQHIHGKNFQDYPEW